MVCLHFLIWHFRRISRIKNAIAVQYRGKSQYRARFAVSLFLITLNPYRLVSEQIHDDDVRLPSEKRLSDSVRINVSRQVRALGFEFDRNSLSAWMIITVRTR